MIIGIDGYEANAGDARVGVGQFAHQILVGMHALTNTYSNIEDIRIYIPGSVLPDMPSINDSWHYVSGVKLPFWTYFGLPASILSDRKHPDIIFSPTHYIPHFISIPRVVSIMDLSYLFYPELFRSKDLYQLTQWTKYSVNHARHIITISQYSKNAIIDAYRTDSSKISVVYPGLRYMTQNDIPFSEIEKKYSLSSPYILSVGTLQPRKNFVRLIEAYSAAKRSIKEDLPTLVIVGKKGWLYEEILRAPARFNVENDVKFLEFVSDNELHALYKHAEIFVLVSLYEGFGLPVLEAMAASCPTVLSKLSSLPEIAGETAIYVDPNNTESITQGLCTAIRKRGTKEEKIRIEEGLKRTKLFRWDNAAKETLDILTRIVSEGDAKL